MGGFEDPGGGYLGSERAPGPESYPGSANGSRERGNGSSGRDGGYRGSAGGYRGADGGYPGADGGYLGAEGGYPPSGRLQAGPGGPPAPRNGDYATSDPLPGAELRPLPGYDLAASASPPRRDDPLRSGYPGRGGDLPGLGDLPESGDPGGDRSPRPGGLPGAPSPDYRGYQRPGAYERDARQGPTRGDPAMDAGQRAWPEAAAAGRTAEAGPSHVPAPYHSGESEDRDQPGDDTLTRPLPAIIPGATSIPRPAPVQEPRGFFEPPQRAARPASVTGSVEPPPADYPAPLPPSGPPAAAPAAPGADMYAAAQTINDSLSGQPDEVTQRLRDLILQYVERTQSGGGTQR